MKLEIETAITERLDRLEDIEKNKGGQLLFQIKNPRK